MRDYVLRCERFRESFRAGFPAWMSTLLDKKPDIDQRFASSLSER